MMKRREKINIHQIRSTSCKRRDKLLKTSIGDAVKCMHACFRSRLNNFQYSTNHILFFVHKFFSNRFQSLAKTRLIITSFQLWIDNKFYWWNSLPFQRRNNFSTRWFTVFLRSVADQGFLPVMDGGLNKL